MRPSPTAMPVPSHCRSSPCTDLRAWVSDLVLLQLSQLPLQLDLVLLQRLLLQSVLDLVLLVSESGSAVLGRYRTLLPDLLLWCCLLQPIALCRTQVLMSPRSLIPLDRSALTPLR